MAGHTRRQTHAHLTKTPPGTCELPYRALTWPLTWCEGSARPLHAHVPPALLLVTDMHHWDLGPLLYGMGHWREGRVLGRPPANRRLRRLQRAPAAACSTCCSYTRSSTHSAATPLRRLLVLLPLLPALILPLPRPPLPCELAARISSARQCTHTNSCFKLHRLFLPRDPFTASTASLIDFPGSSTHVGLAHQP